MDNGARVSTAAPSVFLSYVREDEDSLRSLETHLRPLRDAGKIAPWSARAIHPGADTAATLGEQLGAADVVLLLLSADYLASEAANREMAAALRKRHAEGATIVPVLVRPCLVDETPLGRFRPLPENGEPISTWTNSDLAWLSVAKAVREHVATRAHGKTSAPAPPPLPRAPHFLGRDVQAGDVVKALVAAPPQPVLLQGGPGIGKTTLSIAVVRRPDIAKHFGARRVFARLDGATTGDAVLATVATAAGLTPGTSLRAALHVWLAEALALVVLDNLETPYAADREGTEAAIAWLADVTDVAVLASVRGTERPSGARWKAIELRPLGAPHDADLFCELAEEHAGDREAVRALVAPLGGVPLAIALLAHAAQGNPLSNLRAEWEMRRSAALDRGGGDRHASWAACVELSFRSPRMTPEAERLAGVLALLPEGAAIEDLPQLLAGQAVVPAAARVLSQVGLAHFENGRLRMLPPMRDHVRAAHPAEAADRERAMEHYRSMAQTLGPRVGAPGGREAIERLAPEWANMAEVLGAGLATGTPAPWIDAAAALHDFVRFSGLGSEAPLEKARAAARRTEDTTREARCIWSLGDIALQRSDHGTAHASYEQALPLFRKVGDVLGEANCIRRLGDIPLRRSDHNAARASYEQALPLFRKVGDVLGEANCIRSLGDIALERSDHDAARACYQEALLLYRKVGSVLGEAHCIRSLGDIALGRSDHGTAHASYEHALPLFRKVGAVLGEANCIRSLGDVALGQADHGAAQARYQEALLLYRKVGAVVGEANCIQSLGDVALGRADHDAARARYQEALPLYRKVGAVLGEANCIFSLGDVALGRADHDAARASYEQALSLYTRIQDLYSMGRTERLLAHVAATDTVRRRHVDAARRLWIQIDRPDLVASLDEEFPS